MNSQATINDTTSTYYVRSSKNPYRFYEVATEPTGCLRCSCPAAVYRPTRPCRHVKAVTRGECLVAKQKVPTVTAEVLDGESLWSASVRV
jgi:hypothetical protein